MNMRRGAVRLVLAATLVLGFPALSLASTPDQQGSALAAVAKEVAQSEAFVAACAQRFPETGAANGRALAAWKARNGLQDYEAVLVSLGRRSPQTVQPLADLRASYVALILKQSDAKLGPICRGLPGTLEQANSNTLKTEHASDLAVIAEVARGLKAQAAGGAGADAGASTTLPATTARGAGTLYSLAQLSGVMAGTYDSTKTYAQKDGAVVAKLRALGTIYVRGVAGEHDWLEFEQGKVQSRYKVECAFPSSADSAAFSRARGREVVISGRINKFQSYFGAVLQDCTLVSNTAGLKPSSLPEQAGLKRKALTAQEVMTQPGAGLKPSQIQGLYFYSKNDQRMDGFGNLYMNVESRTYLVLKDGSAYSYTWGFPPEDFNAAVSKREEPAAWGRWNSASYDGIDGSDFDQVLPVPKGWKLGRSFSLTATGQGGSLSERGLTFRSDGRFSSVSTAALAGFTQGGGAAGSGITTAGSTVVTSAPGGQTTVAAAGGLKSAEGTYSADGYTLTLKLPGGGVSRNFIGIPRSTSAANPQYIVYRGELWFADEK